MKRSRRLGFAIFALAVSMALTVTSTFAWFTRAGTPEINSFDLTAMSDSPSLLISLNQSDTPGDWQTTTGYSSTLDSTDVTNMIGSIIALRMGAFTTTNGIAFTDEALNSKAVNTAHANEGAIISFKIRFRSEVSGLKVGLATGSQISTPSTTGSSIKPVYVWDDIDATGYGMTVGSTGTAVTSLDEGDAVNLSAAYAARFSFVNAAGDAAKVWNPQTTDNIVDNRKATASNYYIISDAAAKNFAVDYRDDLLKVTPPTAAVTPKANDITLDTTDLITLSTTAVNGFYFGETTVNIWLEGWDTSCTNAILSDTFKTILKFVAVV